MKQTKAYRRVARLLVRGGDKDDGVIIGVAAKGSRDVLKAATIYEIREIMGELIIIKVGPAHCGNKPREPGYGVDLSRLVEEQPFYLTRDEYKDLVERSNTDPRTRVLVEKKFRERYIPVKKVT